MGYEGARGCVLGPLQLRHGFCAEVKSARVTLPDAGTQDVGEGPGGGGCGAIATDFVIEPTIKSEFPSQPDP
jgi:hypothetical protein